MTDVRIAAIALQAIRPGAQWTIGDAGYSSLNWLDLVQVKPTQAEFDTAVAKLGASPIAITALQFRRAVRAAGKAQAVITAIGTLTADQQDCWQFAKTIRRDADFVAALQTAMTLTDAQVNSFFTQAATFPAD